MKRNGAMAKMLIRGGMMAGIAGAGYLLGRHPVDFPVYYRSAENLLHGTGPLYGPKSGLGWPMYYRYPPVFLFIFLPMILLPLRWAASLWAVGKIAALLGLLRWLRQHAGLEQLPLYEGWEKIAAWLGRNWRAWMLTLLLAGTYLLVEFRYGNVEFFIFFLTALALLTADKRPWAAGAAMGSAIAIKVWPLFFIPYWLVQKKNRAAAAGLLAALLFTLLPAGYFGWQGNEHALWQWAGQEWQTAAKGGTLWYPSQSLRGVMDRYLAVRKPRPVQDAAAHKGYAELGCGCVSDQAMHALWIGLEGLGYGALLWGAWKMRDSNRELSEESRLCMDGIAICGLALLSPFIHIEDLCVLLWPAIAAGVWLQRRSRQAGDCVRSARICLWSAAITAGVIPLIPGSAAQRWLQAAGADCGVVMLLALGLTLAVVQGSAAARQKPATAAMPR